MALALTLCAVQGSQFGAEYIEVIGEVNPDLSLRELANASFGDNFRTCMRAPAWCACADAPSPDMQNYNELVLLSREFPQLFG